MVVMWTLFDILDDILDILVREALSEAGHLIWYLKDGGGRRERTRQRFRGRDFLITVQQICKGSEAVRLQVVHLRNIARRPR